MTTFTTVADLEGLADGQAVLVRRVITGPPTIFTKMGKGLAREGATVPFDVFRGALAHALVTDDEQRPDVGGWYSRSIWLYYVVGIDDEQIRFMLFRNGRLVEAWPRVRTRRDWDAMTLSQVGTEDGPMQTRLINHLLHNLTSLSNALEANRVQIGQLSTQQPETAVLRQRLSEIASLASL